MSNLNYIIHNYLSMRENSKIDELVLAAVMYYVINKTEWLSEVNENTIDT